MPFAKVVVYPREQNAVAVSKACLHQIHLLTTFSHGLPAPRVLKLESENIKVHMSKPQLFMAEMKKLISVITSGIPMGEYVKSFLKFLSFHALARRLFSDVKEEKLQR